MRHEFAAERARRRFGESLGIELRSTAGWIGDAGGAGARCHFGHRGLRSRYEFEDAPVYSICCKSLCFASDSRTRVQNRACLGRSTERQCISYQMRHWKEGLQNKDTTKQKGKLQVSFLTMVLRVRCLQPSRAQERGMLKPLRERRRSNKICSDCNYILPCPSHVQKGYHVAQTAQGVC